MDHSDNKDYSMLDHPQILQFLFHPRRDYRQPVSGLSEDIIIPVADNVQIGARMHHARKEDPLILFFHGNGEVVSDYDDMGPAYTEMGINFLPVDYRGPYSDGEALYRACGSSRKSLIRIQDADHNTIFYYGAKTYFKAIQDYLKYEILNNR